MLTLHIASVLLAATYHPVGSNAPIEARVGKESLSCMRIAPAAAFVVQGPAEMSLRLLVDQPSRGRPKKVELSIRVDDQSMAVVVKPRRSHKSSYTPDQGAHPSRPGAATAVSIPEGEHVVEVGLPAGRAGCLVIAGAEYREAPPPAAAPEPPPAATDGSGSTEASSATTSTFMSRSGGRGRLQAPPLEPIGKDASANDTADVHEIEAVSVDASPVSETSTESTEAREPVRDHIQLGARVGGLLPRGELGATVTAALRLEVPVASVGGPSALAFGGVSASASVFASVGYCLLQQQTETLIPGRGQGQLMQRSRVFPVDVGALVRFGLGASLTPFASIGLAMDVTRTEVQVFSLPAEKQNDVSFGVSAGAGLAVTLGPGELAAELRYREIGADLGEWGDVAESTMATGALYLGYLVFLDG